MDGRTGKNNQRMKKDKSPKCKDFGAVIETLGNGCLTPKPILLIEVPAYEGEFIDISEGGMTLNDLMRNAFKIKDWHIIAIQTQKPEFDYRVFYPPGIPETIEEIRYSLKSMRFPKVAETEEEAFDIEEKFSDVPHGWIQWKGTEVCMDVHCKCGESFHIDATFAYNVKCPECETIYAVNGHVELIELQDKSVNSVTATTE